MKIYLEFQESDRCLEKEEVFECADARHWWSE